MFDPEAYERELVVDATFSRLDARRPIELESSSANILEELIGQPDTLARLGADKATAASFIWRLGIANGLRVDVMESMTAMTDADDTLLGRMGHERRSSLVRGIAEEAPLFLQENLPDSIRGFWEVAGYDTATDSGRDPTELISCAWQLMPAQYVPSDFMDKLYHYRNHSSVLPPQTQLESITSLGDSLGFEVAQSSEREQELYEAEVRTLCSVFVAHFGQKDEDYHTARHIVEDFAFRALTDTSGLADALTLANRLHEMPISRTRRGSPIVEALDDRLVERAALISLIDTPLNQLMDIGEELHRFRKVRKDPQLEGLFSQVLSILDDYDRLFASGADPHIENPQASTLQEMRDISIAAGSRADLTRVLAVMRNETPPAATFETVTSTLASEGFSTKLVAEAFTLVGSELDGTVKQRLLVEFDDAIMAALQGLDPNNELAGPNALKTLTESDLGMLARFPSGRQYIAERTKAYAKLVISHLEQPDEWLNKQDRPAQLMGYWLEHFQNALLYNFEYTKDLDLKSIEMISAVNAALAGIHHFLGTTTTAGHDGLLAESATSLLQITDSFRASAFLRALRGPVEAERSVASPIGRLLLYYHTSQ